MEVCLNYHLQSHALEIIEGKLGREETAGTRDRIDGGGRRQGRGRVATGSGFFLWQGEDKGEMKTRPAGVWVWQRQGKGKGERGTRMGEEERREGESKTETAEGQRKMK